MNYPPNTTHWRPGDIVLHDADEKSPRMVMRVVGYRKDGTAMCRYICPSQGRNLRTILDNDIRYLHDTTQFGIRREWGDDPGFSWEEAHHEWVRVRRWNYHHRPGTKVRTTSAERERTTTTTTEAYVDNAGQAVVELADGGLWLLQFVKRAS